MEPPPRLPWAQNVGGGSTRRPSDQPVIGRDFIALGLRCRGVSRGPRGLGGARGVADRGHGCPAG